MVGNQRTRRHTKPPTEADIGADPAYQHFDVIDVARRQAIALGRQVAALESYLAVTSLSYPRRIAAYRELNALAAHHQRVCEFIAAGARTQGRSQGAADEGPVIITMLPDAVLTVLIDWAERHEAAPVQMTDAQFFEAWHRLGGPEPPALPVVVPPIASAPSQPAVQRSTAPDLFDDVDTEDDGDDPDQDPDPPRPTPWPRLVEPLPQPEPETVEQRAARFRREEVQGTASAGPTGRACAPRDVIDDHE